jgi:hypothetical protein
MQIVGIMLVRNEDLFVRQAALNALGVCDRLLVADHQSTDATLEVLQPLAARDSRIEVHSIRHPAESHALVAPYAGTDTWMLGVDGDELYDPAGLAELRRRLEAGDYDSWWQVFGNVLNCVELDPARGTARGYLAPPCRSMTKLYNFAAIDRWEGPCPERLHEGNIHFRPGFAADRRLNLHEQIDWDRSFFRCLHVCFLRRSSLDPDSDGPRVRDNLMDRRNRGPLGRARAAVRGWMGSSGSEGWKLEKYRRGPCVEQEVTEFFGCKLR